MDTSPIAASSSIIKDSIATQFTGVLNPIQVLITLAISFALGLFILFIYRKTFIGVLYSRSFAVSLVMITMITSLIILPITSNLILSLGMVGALSIVRFRTAVKDPMDTMFLFWGIAAGLCTGASYWGVACIGSIFIGFVMILMNVVKINKTLPYLLVIHYEEEAEKQIKELLPTIEKYNLKSKTIRGKQTELTIEIQIKNNDDSIVEKFSAISGVKNTSLLKYQGDLIS